MHSNDNHPRLINVQNCDDMNSICNHFKVGKTIFKDVADYANYDENPSEPAFFNDLQKCTGTIFVTGFTTFYKLLGEQKLKELLNKLVAFTNSTLHIIIMCFQCEKQLDFLDTRYKNWVYLVDGVVNSKTNLVFLHSSASMPGQTIYIDGIHRFASTLEKSAPNVINIKTAKTKSLYSYSLISISEQANAYELLCTIEPMTNKLSNDYGLESQWVYALDIIKEYNSWDNYAVKVFSGTYTLDLSLQKWNEFDSIKRWMYFILLKLFGTPNSPYLNDVIENVSKVDNFEKEIYQGILRFNHTENMFWEHYKERKQIICRMGISDLRMLDFCDWVLSKQKDAIYYLTDLTSKEIYLIFQTLDNYQNGFSKNEIVEILRYIYPDLYDYLQYYDYKNDLLNRYFEAYKYQKVINHVSDEFLSLVEEQAIKRDYNYILPLRSDKVESIDMNNTLVYFVDAMGVEYLSFIMAFCKRNDLMAYTTLCHCEIPSLTCKNKDFVEVFKNHGGVFGKDENGIKLLDEVKHHGEEEFDYTHNKLPTYLAKELEIITKLMKKVVIKLKNYNRVVLISDHGASRLSVISNKENKHEMATNGMHSGRCCPKSESDIPPECAIEGDDFWVLANYDRFKGGRAANVEVHGGASLEEVVIPIIEITKLQMSYEFVIKTERIKFSKRKKDAVIEIYSKTKISGISVQISRIDGRLKAVSNDGHNFTIAVPNMKATDNYTVDVYLEDNLISEGHEFYAENSDFKEKKIL